MTAGIGLSNVNERLKVIYGDHFELRLTSVAGAGDLCADRDTRADGRDGVAR